MKPAFNTPYQSDCSRAFSLLELLVVLATFGILVAILIPVAGRARIAGETAACLSNLRQLATATQLYSTDHSGELVPISSGNNPGGEGAQTWRLLLMPYIAHDGGPGIFACPSDRKATTFDRSRGLLPASYGINRTIGLHGYLTNVTGSPASHVVRPNNTILLSDMSLVDNPGAEPGHWTDNRRLPGAGNFGYVRFPSDSFYSGDPWISFPRHGMFANIAFYDGHVESIDPDRIVRYQPGDPNCLYGNN